jgi:hypothetical protein
MVPYILSAELFYLLGCYAGLMGISVTCRATYWSYLPNCLTLEDGTGNANYQSMLHNIPEDRRVHLCHHGSLESCIFKCCLLTNQSAACPLCVTDGDVLCSIFKDLMSCVLILQEL